MYKSGSAVSRDQVLTRQKASACAQKCLRISEDYREIAAEAFRENPKIRTLELPDSLRFIGARAFSGCIFLKEAALPHSVQGLGAGCFSGCSHLQTVYMSGRITEIPKDAFREDRRLERVLFTRGSRLKRIRENAFSECTSLQFMLLPSGVESIDSRAFYRCKELHSVRFPEGLKSIGENAFYFCAMKTLELPESLETLGDSAFFKCCNLTEVCLPTGVRHIGKWVFHGCSRLKVLEIRHDPESIGPWIINRAARIRCRRGSKADLYCQEYEFETEYID